MIFEPFQFMVRSDIPTGSYLVGDSEAGEVAWVDPAAWDDRLVALVRKQGWKVTALLLTHGHGDHTGGVQEALKEYNCPLYGQKSDLPAHLEGEIREVGHGDRIPVGKMIIRVFETGGHTPGSVTYCVGTYLFTGDALFAGSVGGTSNDAAGHRQRTALTESVFPLGHDLIVCPGHGPMSRLDVEMCYNPFLGG